MKLPGINVADDDGDAVIYLLDGWLCSYLAMSQATHLPTLEMLRDEGERRVKDILWIKEQFRASGLEWDEDIRISALLKATGFGP